jgi:hypothetical protein
MPSTVCTCIRGDTLTWLTLRVIDPDCPAFELHCRLGVYGT